MAENNLQNVAEARSGPFAARGGAIRVGRYVRFAYFAALLKVVVSPPRS
jgi:hypothetical protein